MVIRALLFYIEFFGYTLPRFQLPSWRHGVIIATCPSCGCQRKSGLLEALHSPDDGVTYSLLCEKSTEEDDEDDEDDRFLSQYGDQQTGGC